MVNNISLDYGDGSEIRNFSSNEGSKVMFTLPANRKFSTFFNVGLEYGSMENVSSDYFSKSMTCTSASLHYAVYCVASLVPRPSTLLAEGLGTRLIV